MRFVDIFKNCEYKGPKATEGFYRGIYSCTHKRSKKKFCSEDCPVLAEYEIVRIHKERTSDE